LDVVITLLISGSLTGGRGEAEEYVRKDLNRVSDDLATRYGDITVQLCQTGFEIIIFSPDFFFCWLFATRRRCANTGISARPLK